MLRRLRAEQPASPMLGRVGRSKQSTPARATMGSDVCGGSSVVTGSGHEQGADAFARSAESVPVVVGAVVAHPPLTRRQASRLARLGLLADEPIGLLGAWTRIEEIWAATVNRAVLLGEARFDERVNGEWSFLEALR